MNAKTYLTAKIFHSVVISCIQICKMGDVIGKEVKEEIREEVEVGGGKKVEVGGGDCDVKE